MTEKVWNCERWKNGDTARWFLLSCTTSHHYDVYLNYLIPYPRAVRMKKLILSAIDIEIWDKKEVRILSATHWIEPIAANLLGYALRVQNYHFRILNSLQSIQLQGASTCVAKIATRQSRSSPVLCFSCSFWFDDQLHCIQAASQLWGLQNNMVLTPLQGHHMCTVRSLLEFLLGHESHWMKHYPCT